MKCSRFNFLTASLCVPLALAQRFPMFTSGCFCVLEAVFVLFLFWFVWILRSSLFCLLRSVQSLWISALPERTSLHRSTRCGENTEEYRSHLDRSLRLLGFLAQAWRSVASSWFRHPRSCFFTRRVGVSVLSFSLAARDLSTLRFRRLVFGDRQARGVRRPFVRNSPLGAFGGRRSR